MWVLKPFNSVFFVVFALFLLLFLLINLFVRKKSERFRRAFLAGVMAVVLVIYFVYKYLLSMDTAYSDIIDAAGIGSFTWWGELPLQLCNINMILIPVAILTKKRPLVSFCFFLGPLGALMALLMPSAGFDGYEILLPRMLGYYFTHWMVFFGSVAIGSFGLFKPTFRDILPTALTALVMTFCIFLMNMVMRWTGVNPHANYFFSVETEGNAILELFHAWIPYPFLYILPCLLILVPYMLIVTVCFRAAERNRRR